MYALILIAFTEDFGRLQSSVDITMLNIHDDASTMGSKTSKMSRFKTQFSPEDLVVVEYIYFFFKYTSHHVKF